MNSQPFIRVYNRIFKNGANSAIDLKTFGNSNSGVNSDVLTRLDSGGDPTPGANAGTITYNINGSDKHIMTGSSFGINTITPGTNALSVNGTTYINGNTGLGITNPNCRLYISSNLAASATVYAMRLSCGASTDAGGFGTLLGLGSEPNGWSKCAIGHTRTGPFDQGDTVFLTREIQLIIL